MLWAHRLDVPIGRWEKVAETVEGLHVSGRVNLQTAAGRDAWESIKAGDATGLSIGFQVPAGGAEYLETGVTRLREIDLHEVSVVAVPANRRARINPVMVGSKGELAALLHKAGLAKSAAARVASGGWPALAGPDQQKLLDLVAVVEAATAKLKEI